MSKAKQALYIPLLCVILSTFIIAIRQDKVIFKHSTSCLRNDILLGINPINTSQFYKHHDIFCHFPQNHATFNVSYLVEFNGLKVPSRFDCSNLNGGKDFNFPYFKMIPDRRTKCLEHESMSQSLMEFYVPKLPIIDEEYEEHTDLYESIYSQGQNKTKLVMIEAGARWGTWGFRAKSAASIFFPEIHMSNYFFETDSRNCEAIHEVAALNDFTDYEVLCEAFSTSSFESIVQRHKVVDMLDVDIQGGENEFLKDAKLLQLFQKHVLYLKIGTHYQEQHEQLLEVLQKDNWQILRQEGIGHYKFHLHYPIYDMLSSWRSWKNIREEETFAMTDFGPMINMDGTIFAKNINLLQ